MKDIVNYEEFMSCLEALYTDTDYGIHPTPATTHACNLRARLEKEVDDPSELSLLDIGCGRGQLIEFYEFSGWVAAGTEIVNRLLSVELATFDEIYPYSVSDLHLLPDNAFDFVFFVNVLDHVWNPEDVVLGIGEGRRIAKYGVVVIVDGEENFQTIDLPNWQWDALFGEFASVEKVELEGFIRILGLNN